jgi:hypothetical protein
MISGIKRLVLLAAFAAGFLAYGEDFGPVSIEVLPAMHQKQDSGFYHIYDFRIHNKSTAPVGINLELIAQGWGLRGFEQVVERKVLVPPGTVVQSSLFFPAWFYHLNVLRLRVFINGREVKHSLALKAGYDYYRILVSPSIPYKEYRVLKLMESVNPTTITTLQWGRHLRDYIGLGRIYLTPEDRLTPETAEAIMQWVRLGGILMYCVLPDTAWPEDVPGAETGLHEKTVDWGRIVYCRPIAAEHRETVEKFILAHQGTPVNQIEDQSIPDTGPGAQFMRNNKLNISLGGPENSVDLLPNTASVPYRLIFGVMLVFSILIGPVSFWILKRKRKEPWILVTTPLISLVFCILVIVFITFNEGWHSRGRTVAITLLDQAEHRAVTKVWGAIYAPVPRGNVVFPIDDCVAFSENCGSYRLNLDSGQRFSSGLVRPRMTAGYTVNRVEDRHERLQVRGLENGQLRVVNGLGGALKSLSIVGPGGRIFQAAEPIAAGASVLIPFSGKISKFRNADALTSWTYHSDNSVNVYSTTLAPGYYMAQAEAPLFFTPGLIPEEFNVEQYIIGRYEMNGEASNGN